MWTEQHLTDAMQLLLDADSLEKVVTDESPYIVASGVSYTDELYLKALDELIEKKQLVLSERAGERSIYKRPEDLGTAQQRRAG